jgi:hypothetical protein
MFAPKSRYYSLLTLQYTLPGGLPTAYKSRRFLVNGNTMPLRQEVTVTQGDRIDLITAKALGDPEQFWRICDANNALDPFDLTATVGRVLRVPIPQF